MKIFITLLIFLSVGLISAAGQSYPSSVYYTSSGRERTASEVETSKRIYDSQRADKRFDQMRSMASDSSPFVFNISKEDRELISPSKEDQKLYRQVLKMPNTKMVKILNASCFQIVEDGKTAELNSGCKTALPGFGAFYSFRNEEHSFKTYSDLQLFQDWFVSAGFLTQGIMVDLGDADFEKITLADNGLKFLAEFVPAQTPEEADNQIKKIEDGIEKDGFYYNRAVRLKENNVYVMRSIAYRSKLKTIGDKRDDVIVIFKVIRRDKEGNVTLIWRELQSKDAPKLKVKEK